MFCDMFSRNRITGLVFIKSFSSDLLLRPHETRYWQIGLNRTFYLRNFRTLPITRLLPFLYVILSYFITYLYRAGQLLE